MQHGPWRTCRGAIGVEPTRPRIVARTPAIAKQATLDRMAARARTALLVASSQIAGRKRVRFVQQCFIPSCMCVPGKWTSTAFSACQDCDPGRWASQANTTSSCTGPCKFVSLSWKHLHASVSANYYCPAGSIHPNAQQCPQYTQSPPGSTSLSDCVCIPGASGAGGGPTCTLCPAGAFQHRCCIDQSRFQCTSLQHLAWLAAQVRLLTLALSPCVPVCPVGTWSGPGNFTCTNCTAGWCSALVAVHAVLVGRYGTGASTSASCSGICAVNYWCDFR